VLDIFQHCSIWKKKQSTTGGLFSESVQYLSVSIGCTTQHYDYLTNYRFKKESPSYSALSIDFFNAINSSLQENIPKATAEKVKRDILGGVELALGLSKGSLRQPMYTRVQLWYNKCIP
jgi:hypothetical protein